MENFPPRNTTVTQPQPKDKGQQKMDSCSRPGTPKKSDIEDIKIRCKKVGKTSEKLKVIVDYYKEKKENELARKSAKEREDAEKELEKNKEQRQLDEYLKILMKEVRDKKNEWPHKKQEMEKKEEISKEKAAMDKIKENLETKKNGVGTEEGKRGKENKIQLIRAMMKGTLVSWRL